MVGITINEKGIVARFVSNKGSTDRETKGECQLVFISPENYYLEKIESYQVIVTEMICNSIAF